MSNQPNALLQDLQSRNLVSQLTAQESFHQHLSSGCKTVYCGFDPTADSLHIGHLVPLLALKRFQQAGHQPIALVGGATGLIGDPSFKANERKLNPAAVVSQWVDRIKQQVSQFISFDCGENSALVVNNLDWTADLHVLTFMRDIGKHFSVNAMIQKESVKQRITRDGSGISFTEFSYMILQSYDFAQLNKRYNCTVQIGGSDQWGNITGGIDLTRRLNQQQVFGLTTPLVTKADGTKFGKTEGGSIWLDATKTSQYAFYQFWINVADADVYNFLRYFTFLSADEIDGIAARDASVTGKPEAQELLAREVTELVHGQQGLEAATRISKALFCGDLSNLTETDFAQLRLDGLPSSQLTGEGISLVSALVESGLAKSNKMAREFIANNAVSINGVKVSALDYELKPTEGLFGQFFVLKRGKKLFHLVSRSAS